MRSHFSLNPSQHYPSIYNHNVNLTVKHSYDADNHLIRVETTRFGATIVVEYAYDADGNRVRKTIDGTVVVNYLVDTNRDYAQVLEERDGSGNLLVRYVYGHDLISQTRPSAGSGTDTTYYHYDGMGSTRALTADSEAVTDTYDAFGNLLDKTGVTENTHLYTGEFFDSNLGFYYLRARYMNPAIGRFVTMDPFGGFSRDPYSLHKYLYAHANPVNSTDPSGYITNTQDATVSAGIVQRLASMSICIAKRACPFMIASGIFGAFQSGIDHMLGGGSILDLGDVMIDGALNGASVGFWRSFSALRPLLTFMGFKSSLEAVNESRKEGNYVQMLYRAVMLYFQVKAMTNLEGNWDSDACFMGETLVYTPQGYKPIQELDIGDLVYSTEVGSDEQELVQSRVTEIFQRETDTLIDLTIQDGDGNESVITGTPEHPFWVPAVKDFIPMGLLVANQQLRTADGSLAVVVASRTYHGHFTVYNIEVDGTHAYYVASPHGLQAVLVHNIDCSGNSDNVISNADENRTTAENLQVLNSLAEGDGMSGVYDHATGQVLLIRSTGEYPRPEGWVAQRGGHADVFNELTNGTGNLTKLPGRFSGFYIQKLEGKFVFGWNSGQVNSISHGGSYSVPEELRPEIMAAVKKTVDR
ncbi:MAG: hypothetical protein JW902_07330 [Syntrophaceae bacterium]|nr:hypothetical protein [Syntrophaceae bacterium]